MNSISKKDDLKKRTNQEIKGVILSLLVSTFSFLITHFSCFFSNKKFLFFVLLICSILQIVINAICFLKINFLPKKSTNVIIVIFTLLIILILFFGSIWIMEHLHHNLLS